MHQSGVRPEINNRPDGLMPIVVLLDPVRACYRPSGLTCGLLADGRAD